MTILKVTGLTKRFGATDVLRGIDLEVARGEIHALTEHGVVGAIR